MTLFLSQSYRAAVTSARECRRANDAASTVNRTLFCIVELYPRALMEGGLQLLWRHDLFFVAKLVDYAQERMC